MSRKVVLSPEAETDLNNLYLYVAGQSGRVRALTYTNRILDHIRGLADFSERGTRRDDLYPGLRMLGFERRVAIAFRIRGETVVVDRVLYGGRDLESLEDPS